MHVDVRCFFVTLFFLYRILLPKAVVTKVKPATGHDGGYVHARRYYNIVLPCEEAYIILCSAGRLSDDRRFLRCNNINNNNDDNVGWAMTVLYRTLK